MHKKFFKMLTMFFCLVTMFTLVGCGETDVQKFVDSTIFLGEYEEQYGEYVSSSTSSKPYSQNYVGDEKPNIVINNEELSWYFGQPSIEVNNNKPFFDEEITTNEFEFYAKLDNLERCGETFANISPYTMPTEERGEIGHIKPTGWHTVKYDCVDGKYLYNRCHLIGFQLAGENDNEKNLITGTRYLNIEGMLPYENMIADYVKETKNHVLYRVTPIFENDNLLSYGVLMEAYSVEDNGNGICFNVFAYNVQPGITIDYKTGESWLTSSIGEPTIDKTYTENVDGIVYILNTNSKKYHYEDCNNAKTIKEKNKETFNGTIEWLQDNGYSPCGQCNPK